MIPSIICVNAGQTHLGLVSGEEAQFDGTVQDLLPVVHRGRANDLDVLVGEVFAVRSRGAEVEQRDLQQIEPTTMCSLVNQSPANQRRHGD